MNKSKHLEVRKFVGFLDSKWRETVHVCYLDWMYVEGTSTADEHLEDAMMEIAERESISRNLLMFREVSY